MPQSQQSTLASLIDHAKRKGVTITVEQEIYELLYHMESNRNYYYSRAKNFKHRYEILIRQLMQNRLNKSVGFKTWKPMINSNTLSKVI